MRKIIACILVLCCLCSMLLPVAASNTKSSGNFLLPCENTKNRYMPLVSCNGTGICPCRKFNDTANHWAHDSIDFAVLNGLFGGMSSTTFEPNTATTRAMLVTVLWRYDGKPDVWRKASFNDLTSDWYMEPVAWAEDTGVVNGVGQGKFAPDSFVTREQLLTMIWRYAGKEAPDDDNAVKEFPDHNKISDYAVDAFNWGIENGIINGKDGKLDPTGKATRAEFAKIMMVFDQDRAETEENNEEDTEETSAAPSEEPTESTKPTTPTTSAKPTEEPTSESEEYTEPTEFDEGAFVLSSTIKAGDEVIIVCAAKNIAFSNDKSVNDNYYNVGVAVHPVDGKITDAPETIVWTVGNKNGYYTFSYGDQNIAMGTQFFSTNLGEVNDTWTIEEALTDGASYIKNVGREAYLEWCEAKNCWSCYYNNSDEELFAMNFYVKGAETEPTEPTFPSEEPLEPTEGYVAIYNDANGKVMTSEVSEYTSSLSGITKRQLVSADASLNAEGKLITDATNIPVFRVETLNGITSFVTADGKYLSCDGTNLEIVDTASENTEFVLEETEGGYFIRLANFLYNGIKPQYIEFYRDVFTVFGMGVDSAIFTFTFRELAAVGDETTEAPGEEPTEPTSPHAPVEDAEPVDFADLKDDDVIAIVMHTSPEMTDKDFVLLNNFCSTSANNAADTNRRLK